MPCLVVIFNAGRRVSYPKHRTAIAETVCYVVFVKQWIRKFGSRSLLENTDSLVSQRLIHLQLRDLVLGL